MSPSRDETQVALLTAPGPGAIAVALLRGPGARSIIESSLRPGGARSRRLLQATQADGTLLHGHIIRDGELIDEVIVACVPDSAGGEAAAYEINCHGGVVAARRVHEFLVSLGARGCDWRDLLAGGDVEREGHLAMINAATASAARAFASVAAGELSLALVEIADSLDAAASGPPDGRARSLERAAGLAGGLLATRVRARKMAAGVRIAIAGAPNVGKSTLANAIAARDVALVDDAPGTTRDPVTFRRALGGVEATVIDTAGLRERAGRVERQGISRARAAMGEADCVIVVVDARDCGKADARRVTELVPADRRVVAVNKTDLVGDDHATRAAEFFGSGAVAISALTGVGVALLLSAAHEIVGLPEEPPDGVVLCHEGAARLLEEVVALASAGDVDEERVGEVARALRSLSTGRKP